ncbi:MAG: hypothetical protein KAW56_10135 [Candidatus Marinimicrobia bacterium]|nr:hypothetical protein [Candidatus Neomarinimicrobiota bacterium]
MEIKEDYEIEGAINTLLRAEEIKKDNNLMTKIMKVMNKKQKDISDILRNAAIKVSSKK